MAKEQLTLNQKIEKVAREMCRDLGLNPDDELTEKYFRWQEYSKMVQDDLVHDSMTKAKERLWQGKI